jgi:thymidylate kinase
MAGAGVLIALEGAQDALLEAHAERLFRWLRERGVAVERAREPTNGPVGALIQLARQGRLRFDPASLALLAVADRMDHLEREGGILSWLEEGRVVLCVHYSVAAYARAPEGVEWAWLRLINARCRPPDLALWIDARGAAPLVRRYRQVAARLQAQGEPLCTIDGRGTADEIHAACQRQVANLLSIETGE